jgi:hypothetical protein
VAEKTGDPEITAMQEIASVMERLEDIETRRRVLKWVTDRFGGGAKAGKVEVAAEVENQAVGNGFGTFHELVDATQPQTGLQRILVTAYWYQVSQAHENFDSFQVNKELKNLGHPSGNITRDLESLIGRSPQLVMQVRKDGTTKQARKRYRLTREGIRAVDQMLAGQEGGLE